MIAEDSASYPVLAAARATGVTYAEALAVAWLDDARAGYSPAEREAAVKALTWDEPLCRAACRIVVAERKGRIFKVRP